MTNSNNNKLAFGTFDLYIKANTNSSQIFHSDRGFQYTSSKFKLKLDEKSAKQSMSRVGRYI
ncbi:hypothetical protein [Paraclostridium bifermentans]|uniref:hypothetical protein n=1 Tax=Paraclostridium bifermentans TaxID=1490 RepID=UPI00374F7100